MMRVRLAVFFKSALAAALSAAALSSDAPAQQRSAERAREARSPTQGRDAQAQRAGGADANADLSITARVTADSLRFEKVPNTRVEFTGKPERETVWEAERENLPPQVQPGVTYRNIGITLRITSVFADIDRIVAEALGEVPVDDNDEARPAPATPPATPTPQPPGTSAAPPSSSTPERPAAVTAPTSKSSPANSVTNAPRHRPARRSGGK